MKKLYIQNSSPHGIVIFFICLLAFKKQAQQVSTYFSQEASLDKDVVDFQKYNNKICADNIIASVMQFALTASLRKVKYAIKKTEITLTSA